MRFKVIGKVFVLVITTYLSYYLVFTSIPWTFLDRINLLIHEAGHLMFAFLGEDLMLLGGTIMQILVPSIFLGYFFYQQKFFSVFFCLFWIGNNLINISVYIKDAVYMSLPLVGGGKHDWNLLLTKWGILEKSDLIGSIVWFLGVACILASLILMMVEIFVDFRYKE